MCKILLEGLKVCMKCFLVLLWCVLHTVGETSLCRTPSPALGARSSDDSEEGGEKQHPGQYDPAESREAGPLTENNLSRARLE